MSERSLFIRALEIENPARRAAFLSQECPDAATRQRVEKLLAAHEAAGGILDRPSPASPQEPPATEMHRPITEAPGTQIGPYKLLEQIGEGGFGVVFMAEQLHPVRRKVALKVVKPGMDTRQIIARFEAERQALALMDHPNIARVLDAGETDTGRPYFVMELVKGIPVTTYCDQAQLTARDRLALFVSICQAVQHAHQKGIIHRDLKPSNVLVTLHDGTPVVKVIDFGVAKATGHQLTEKTLFTGFAQMIGTPLYMSPEQAALSGLDIDTRSDVYSLGVLLYELLTGTTPLAGEKLKQAAFDEIRRLIREEEPPKPSTRVHTMGASASTVSAQRKTEPHKLRQLLRNELDWIVMKALEKDRTRRYETANGLARDVQRYLDDQPVEACPPSTAYRVSKFIRRNKVAFTTGTLVAGVLILGSIVSTVLAVVASRERNRAVLAKNETQALLKTSNELRVVAENAKEAEAEQRRLAEAAADSERQAKQAEAGLRRAADEKRDAIEKQKNEIETLSQKLQRASDEQRRMLYAALMNLIPRAWDNDNIPWVVEMLNSARPRPGQEDLRGFEWHYWHRLCNSDVRTTPLQLSQSPLRGFGDPVFSADGSRLAWARALTTSTSLENATTEREISVFDTATGKVVWSHALPPISLRDGRTGPPPGVEAWLSPDGKRVALCTLPRFAGPGSRIEPGYLEIQMFEVGSPTPLYTIQEQARLSRAVLGGGIACCGDGSRFAALVADLKQGDEPAQSAIKIWDATSGQSVATIALLAPSTGPQSASQLPSWSLTLSQDGSRIAASTPDGVKVWEVASGTVVGHLAGIQAFAMAFSPDGARLAVTERSSFAQGVLRPYSVAKIWDIATGAELFSFPEETRTAANFAFSPDGKWLAFPGRAPSIRLYHAATGTEGPLFRGHAARMQALNFSPDSSRLLTVAADGVVKEWSVPDPGPAPAASALASAMGEGRASGGFGGFASLSTNVTAVAPDGSTVARAQRVFGVVSAVPLDEFLPRANQLVLRRAEPSETIRKIELSGPIQALGYSANSRRLFVVAHHSTGDVAERAEIRVVDTATGQEIGQPVVVATLDTRQFASVGPGGTAARTSRIAPTAALSPDGKHLVYSLFTGGERSRSTLRIVEVDTQKLVAEGEETPLIQYRWTYSPDGARLLGRSTISATSLSSSAALIRGIGQPETFAVCDARTAKTLWTSRRVSLSAAFSPDGSQVVALVRRDVAAPESEPLWSIRFWDAASGTPQTSIAVELPSAIGFLGRADCALAISPNGQRVAVSFSDVLRGLPDEIPSGVHVYDVATRTLLYPPLKGHSTAVTGIAFTPDGRRIATGAIATVRGGGGDRGETKLWDATTGQELLTLDGSSYSLSFSADGRHLFGEADSRVAGAWDIRHWNAAPLAPQREAALLVETLLSRPSGGRLPLKAEIQALIAADRTLSAELRAAASERLRTIHRKAEELETASWQIARLPDQPVEEYERALAYVLEASEHPTTPLPVWSSLGVAHYRLKQYDEALSALNRSVELTAAQKETWPEDMAFLSMTHFKLGHKQEAEDFLRRCREAINKSGSPQVREWRGYLAEAEQVMGVASVATELVAGATGPPIAAWGDPVDPIGDCTIKANGDVLSISVPGGQHNLSTPLKGSDAPRVLRAIDGDFIAVVRVTCPIAPKTPLEGSSTTYHGAGLLVYVDDTHFLRVERNGYFRDWDAAPTYGRKGRSPLSSNSPTVEYWHDHIISAQHADWSGEQPQLTGESTWLRIERRGNTMYIALSHDGQKWEEIAPIETSFPKLVRVGVAAMNSSGDEFQAEFSELKFTQPTAQIVGWGEVVDPLGDCTIQASEGKLSVAVPGVFHDLSTDSRRKNLDAPRILREVEGDFSIQVRVSCPLDPHDPLSFSTIAYHGAGLVIWDDDNHFLRVERNAYRIDQQKTRLNCFPPLVEYSTPDDPARKLVPNAGKLVFDPQHTWFRLARRGDSISGAMSHDGVTWQEIPTLQSKFPPSVKVGVHVINNSQDELQAEFSEFSIAQP